MVLCLEVPAFTSLSQYDPFSLLVTWFWYFDYVRTKSPLAVRLLVLLFVARADSPLVRRRIALCVFVNVLLRIEYLRSVLIETSTDG